VEKLPVLCRQITQSPVCYQSRDWRSWKV